MRALLAEAIGTFALVFAGCGAIVADAKTGALGHLGVALTFGLVIMVMTYAVGHISGAHFNPAVTFAFSLSRHFPWSRALGYWAAQIAGALAAAALVRGLTRKPRARRRDASERLAGPGVPVGARAHVLPDVRDHGRRHTHSLAPALVSGDLHALWLYVVAPLAALTYRYLRA